MVVGTPDMDDEDLVRKAFPGAQVRTDPDLRDSGTDGDVQSIIAKFDSNEHVGYVTVLWIYNPLVPEAASLAERRNGGHPAIAAVNLDCFGGKRVFESTPAERAERTTTPDPTPVPARTQ
jgi:hypothetical protein